MNNEINKRKLRRKKTNNQLLIFEIHIKTETQNEKKKKASGRRLIKQDSITTTKNGRSIQLLKNSTPQS